MPRIEAQSERRGIENSQGLTSFFSALDEMKSGRRLEPVRITHYGDSHIAADILTAEIRRQFQRAFGDGGPGYLVARNPMSTPRKGVSSGATSGWSVDGIGNGAGNDGFYGLAGISLTTNKADERMWVETSCNHFEIYYMTWPGGGAIDIKVDGISVLDQPLSLNSDIPGPDYYSYETTTSGNHRIEISTLTPGRTRILGIVAEHIEPHSGVSYDVLGINGARLGRFLTWNKNIFADNLIQRNPDLIIIAYGTNEVTDEDWTVESYARLLGEILDRLRRAAPKASIIVVGPPDRADKTIAGSKMPQLIAAQRRAASRAGAAFWCSYDAMGGLGAMNSWVAQGLGQGDHVHLTGQGYLKMGDMFYEDLMKAYAAAKAKPQPAAARKR
ncbi:MAG TPA: GDSL-type esterase/lipase family protein [Pyrinomonadaceae bacterium]|jgi:lysophospholipase L1-like esterase|nr:GDSL-type esterase/lipase family protein [Pyrinomonadaceae bacterium]